MVLIKVVVNSVVLILLFSYIFYLLKDIIKKANSKNLKIYFIVVAIMHFMISLVFAFFVEKFNTPDAIKFYVDAQETSSWLSLFNIGSSFISFLIYPFVKLGVSREVLFIIFSTISFKGFLVYFELIGIPKLQHKNKWLLLLFLIPSLHFWTGFLGKEALLFTLMVLFLKYLKKSYLSKQLLIVIIVFFLIRPHAAIMMIAGYIIVLLLDIQVAKKIKIMVSIASLVIFFIVSSIFFLYFLKIDSLDLEGIQQYAQNFLTFTELPANGSISIRETSIFERIGYLLVMPLPFLYDINTTLQWFSAIENLYFLSGFIYVIYYYGKYGLKWEILHRELRFAFITSILMIVLFASYLYNLGLGNRMRIMFFPYIFYFLIQTIPERFNNEKKETY